MADAGLIVITAFISPLREDRDKARAGEIKDFTGIDLAYEVPRQPEVHLHAGNKCVERCVNEIMQALALIISHRQN